MTARTKQTSSYNKVMQGIARRYREETGVDDMNLDEMYEWARKKRLYEPRRISIKKQFKREMSRALGRETKEDQQSRTVKANHAYPIRRLDGQTEWHWAPIETIEPKHFQISQTLRRNAMVATAIQHHTDWASFNDNNVHGAQLAEPDYNFNLDVQENLQSDEYPEDAPGENDI